MDGRFIPYRHPSYNASSDGSLGMSDFNYSRHQMDNSPESASYREDPTVVMLRIVSEVWLTMPIALFGIVGNIASLVVLCYHRRLKKLQTVVIQLQTLAVVDTLILITILLLRSFRYVGPEWYVGVHVRMFPWMYPIVYFLRLLSVWLTVLLTVDRYIAVWYPLDARRLCTVRRTYIMITAVTVATFVFSLPRFFEYTFKRFEGNHEGFVSTSLLDNQVYNVVYRISLFIAFQYVIPTLALVCLNARVIVALRRSDTYRLSSARRYPPPPVTSHPPELSNAAVTSSQPTRSITVVVAVIVGICIVVHVVALITHVVATVETNFETQRNLEPVRRHLSQANNVLVTINSAVNFIIYCMISRKFRELLVRRCCCCCFCCSCRSSSRHQVEQHRRGDHCCCWSWWWTVSRWCRRHAGRDSLRQSDGDDSKRITTATNNTEPRWNIAMTPPAHQLAVLMAPPERQRHLVETAQLMDAAA